MLVLWKAGSHAELKLVVVCRWSRFSWSACRGLVDPWSCFLSSSYWVASHVPWQPSPLSPPYPVLKQRTLLHFLARKYCVVYCYWLHYYLLCCVIFILLCEKTTCVSVCLSCINVTRHCDNSWKFWLDHQISLWRHHFELGWVGGKFGYNWQRDLCNGGWFRGVIIENALVLYRFWDSGGFFYIGLRLVLGFWGRILRELPLPQWV